MSNITKSPAKQLKARRKQREREEEQKSKKNEEAGKVVTPGEDQPGELPAPKVEDEYHRLSKYIRDPGLIYKMKQRDFDALYGPFLRGFRIDLAVCSVLLLTAFCLIDAGSLSAFWECNESQLANVSLPTYVFLCSRPHTYPPNWIFNFQFTRQLKLAYMMMLGHESTIHTMSWILTGENEELAFIRLVDYTTHTDSVTAKQTQSLLAEKERRERTKTGDSYTKYVPFEKRMNVPGQAFPEMRKNSAPWLPNVAGTQILDRILGLCVHSFNVLLASGRLPFLLFIVCAYYVLPAYLVYVALKHPFAKLFRYWKYWELLIENKLFYWFGVRV